MKVSVAGLWHLGIVTAACCAHGGHDVVAFDDDPEVINKLQQTSLPVEEPGLADLVDSSVKAGRLRFTNDPSALSSAEILWLCYDTSVDKEDVADVEHVLLHAKQLLPHLSVNALVLISSQLPVGSTGKLEAEFPLLKFAYSPENLRLGRAIEVFTNPDRVVVGVHDQQSRTQITALFSPFTTKLEWMSVKSAEMTKHALNSFLATSVAYINEIAAICEKTGADAQEVESGLKTDVRIGQLAYLHPGSAFAGGTLARDISFLLAMGKEHRVPTHLFRGVLESNSVHKLWAQRHFLESFDNLRQSVIGVLGLTYKPGTNTLRRSSSMEICHWLAEQGARVQAFDPAIRNLPQEVNRAIQLRDSSDGVLDGAHAVLIATPWPEFRSIPINAFIEKMQRKLVLDPSRHLESLLRHNKAVEYLAIGVGA